MKKEEPKEGRLGDLVGYLCYLQEDLNVTRPNKLVVEIIGNSVEKGEKRRKKKKKKRERIPLPYVNVKAR